MRHSEKEKLVIEDNTIYELDLECMARKEEKNSQRKNQDMKKENPAPKGRPRGQRR
ncbi:MAG: hypothetical protein LUF78_04280 [Clostridiales bacterium]|nr:hypothetical protein [Clostridiales bacterium]